jgi:hypothetical protein
VRDARRAGLLRRALRQPRHRPVQPRQGQGDPSDAHQRVRRSPGQDPLRADRSRRRRVRVDGPPGPRVGERRRSVDGRDDRPDDGDPAAGPGALADQHDVDDREAHGRLAAPEPVPEPAGQARGPRGLPRLQRRRVEQDRLPRLPAGRGASAGPRGRDLGPRHQRERHAPAHAGRDHPAQPRPPPARPAHPDAGRARPRRQAGPRLRRTRHGRRDPGRRAAAHRRHGPRPAPGALRHLHERHPAYRRQG